MSIENFLVCKHSKVIVLILTLTFDRVINSTKVKFIANLFWGYETDNKISDNNKL